MLFLRPITTEDIAEIHAWPSYDYGFEQMDYALREQGWFDEFRGRADTSIYAAGSGNKIIGFSLLRRTTDGAGEFRIALHPHELGRGYGRTITELTLTTGFGQLGLKRITLIVRKSNPRAVKLYRNIGFIVTGESTHAIQGKEIEFLDMHMTRERFEKLAIGEAT